MIQKIKRIVEQLAIETRVEKIDSATFGIFYKITIIDGTKYTTMLNKQEFDNLITQIEKAKNE